MKNYYAVLECSPEATQLEIKRNYQRLAREHHPDKGAPSSDKFLLIDEAYRVLKDASSRRDYDATSLANSCDRQTLIYAEFAREALKAGAVFPCRCGLDFVIEAEHLEDPEGVVIECAECSNSVLIR